MASPPRNLYQGNSKVNFFNKDNRKMTLERIEEDGSMKVTFYNKKRATQGTGFKKRSDGGISDKASSDDRNVNFDPAQYN